MSFNRETWQHWDTPKPCPTCKIGKLGFPQNSSNSIINETCSSLQNSTYNAYEHDYIFSFHLKCSYCGEYVAVSGKKNIWLKQDSETYDQVEVISFKPIYYYPAPNIIEIPKECSKEFKTRMKESFSLYWLDLGACLNRIRVSLEVLMSDFGIEETTIKRNGDERNLSLDERIKRFKAINNEVGKILMRVKWVGNAGSHFSDIEEVRMKDVLGTYELLEHCLEILFKVKENRILEINNDLDKKIKKINTRNNTEI